MVIKELLEYGVEELSKNQYTVPLNESRRILSFLFDKTYSQISVAEEEVVDEEEQKKFKNIIKKRKKGEPLQYIINSANFYGYDYYVDERVLIPRFDTENLAYEVIRISTGLNNPAILEIGPGSGAISATIAMENPESSVTGADISNEALAVCEINKEKYKISNLQFINSDVFENIGGKYDIIFSNPPYIKTEDMNNLQIEVKQEPTLALDGGKDGLYFYRKIVAESREYLKPNGYLLFEIGYDQGQDVKNLLLDHGFNKIEIIKDLQGHDRVVKAIMED